MDYSTLSRDELIAKLHEADNVIISFDASLDEALRHEEEIARLDHKLTVAERDLSKCKRELETATAKIYSLTQEKNHMVETHQTELSQRDGEIRKLKQQLVSVEITNDTFENHDRLLQDKLAVATEFNNELLEKVALLESDGERDRRRLADLQLHMTNSQNEASELRDRVRHLEEERKLYVADGDPDMSVVSIARVLDEGPPSPLYASGGATRSVSKSMVKSISQDVHAYLKGHEGMKPSKSSKHLHDIIAREPVK